MTEILENAEIVLDWVIAHWEQISIVVMAIVGLAYRAAHYVPTTKPDGSTTATYKALSIVGAKVNDNLGPGRDKPRFLKPMGS